MSKTMLLTGILLISCIASFGQQNFSISPEKPNAGDLITITYTPAGAIANTMGKVEGVMYLWGKGRKASELVLTKKGKKYVTTIQTDTSNNFVQLGFFVGETFDNNFNDGYFIHLHEKGKVKKGAYGTQSACYQFFGADTGIENDNKKALESLEKEIANYPQQKKALAAGYYRLMAADGKDIKEDVNKEIEAALSAGLKTESDYEQVERLYSVIKENEKAKALTADKKEKFPEGRWTINEFLGRYRAETDIAKKTEMFEAIKSNVKTIPDWKIYETSIPNFHSSLISLYVKNKDWEAFKKATAEMAPRDRAGQYNSVAWDMQEKNEELKFAEEISREATQTAKDNWKNSAATRPDSQTPRNWEAQTKSTYAMYADTYAMVCYRLGEYKKGYDYALDAAITVRERKDADLNNTYALLAEKVLPPQELKTELEKFVKGGTGTSVMKDMLKAIYVKEKDSEVGFDTYVSALERETYLKMVEEIKKSMVNTTTPMFTLTDLDGNNVSIESLKGKVVVLDFWATWCGPCKASFPAMQKIVTKYKDNPDVKFLFIDTWERENDKQKNAADFIVANKYTFQVLMDNDDKVVEQFKVDGIPTKFVIDRDGKTRFKSVGFSGSDDKLVSELTTMIQLATNGELPSGE